MSKEQSIENIESKKSISVSLSDIKTKRSFCNILLNWSKGGKQWSKEIIENIILIENLKKVPEINKLIMHYKYFSNFDAEYEIKIPREEFNSEFRKYIGALNSINSSNNVLSAKVNNNINKNNSTIGIDEKFEYKIENSLEVNQELDINKEMELDELDDMDFSSFINE